MGKRDEHETKQGKVVFPCTFQSFHKPPPVGEASARSVGRAPGNSASMSSMARTKPDQPVPTTQTVQTLF